VSGHTLEMDSRHRYWCTNPEHKEADCAGVIFESVTTILGKAVPKNLAWYGQTRGVIGVKGLLRIPKYDVRAMKPGEVGQACAAEGIGITPAGTNTTALAVRLSAIPKYDVGKLSPDAITDALKREKLTVNDHRDQAAEGGTAVHNALEEYIKRGIIPSAAKVPEAKRASIRGLAKFIIDYRPEFIASEVKTVSTAHGYAGTFDFLANIHARLDKVSRWERNGGGAMKTKDAKLVLVPDPNSTLTALVDLKTSKYVYPTSHFPQLEAYEGARIEAGEPPTDVRAVLWVNNEGEMDLVPSSASFEDFLALKRSAEVLGRLDKSWTRPRKARA